MPTRRTFIKTGLGLAVFGLPRSSGIAAAFCAGGRVQNLQAPKYGGSPFHVLLDLGNTVRPADIGTPALPFLDGFNMEPFEFQHSVIAGGSGSLGTGGALPHATEEAPIVIVGGGIAGLATAYLLRDLKPVLLEQGPRFGGVAQAEVWNNVPYSLGGAYLIDPDPGSELEALYAELGLDEIARIDLETNPVELRGRILRDFWEGEGSPAEDAGLFEKFAELNEWFIENYPEIPLTEETRDWVMELDGRTFREDVFQRLGGRVPELLSQALQQYCYSSMGAAMEELSAAAAWNFVSAEYIGRWTFAGGLGAVARALWTRLCAALPPENLRTGSGVFDVRLAGDGARVSYKREGGPVQSIQARRVVMAAPKFICKRIMPGLDAERLAAMDAVHQRAYVVVNVLLNVGLPDDFYDLWLLRDATLPTPETAAQWHRVTDVISATWATGGGGDSSVLTMYWPLAFDPSRHAVVTATAWDEFAQKAGPQISSVLELLDVPVSAVAQIRMTRWGHPMPIARPGFYRAGYADILRKPLGERIFFVNQDNWALPAIETSLLEALHFAPRVAEGLRKTGLGAPLGAVSAAV